MSEEFPDFQAFWPFYLSQHADPVCRRLHVFGTLAGLGVALLGVLAAEAKLFLLAPGIGYGCAWIGHFGFEKNRPATFRYPRYSLLGDLRMLRLFLTGALPAELRKFGIPG